MIVALHPDAGPQVGLGHAMRCCNLAVALRQQEMIPVIINTAGPILTRLLTQLALPELRCDPSPAALVQATRRVGARLLVADSYRLDRLDLRRVAGDVKLAWFDDHGHGPWAADVIINGSPAAAALPYHLPAPILGLLGPAYQVVRPSLTARTRDGVVRRLLVTYGGADPHRVGPWLAGLLPADLDCDFVVGPFADTPPDLPAAIRLHKAPEDMAALIDGADLALSSGGQTLFELAAAQVPTIAFGLGEDQRPNLEAFDRAQAIAFAGWAADRAGTGARIRELVTSLRQDADRRAALAANAHALIDGQGGQRVAAALRSLF